MAMSVASQCLRPLARVSPQRLAARASPLLATSLPSNPLASSDRRSTVAVPRRSTAGGVRAASTTPDFQQLVKDKNASSPVVVYSKSWCPYCTQVKGLFKKLGVEALVLELDSFVEEQDIQDALFDLTGQKTVPNVFIGGKHIGGCDSTMDLQRSGELTKLLEAAGVTVAS